VVTSTAATTATATTASAAEAEGAAWRRPGAVSQQVEEVIGLLGGQCAFEDGTQLLGARGGGFQLEKKIEASGAEPLPRHSFASASGTHPHSDSIKSAFRHYNERLHYVADRFQRCEDAKHKGRRDMARPQIHDTNEWLTCLDGERPEISIVCEYDSALSFCIADDIDVISTEETFVPHTPNVFSLPNQHRQDLWVDVLVGEQGKIERLHAGTFTSHTTSFLSDRAAYWKTAVSASAVTCG
jgi:hypothetical protein